jgi:hypothetical protein
MKKLSGRPFLIVQFTEVPREGVDTKVKGWATIPGNIKTMEQVSVVDRVANKHLGAAVIIDLVEGTVERNQTNKQPDELVAHYIARYEDTIKQALQVWAMKEMGI